MTCGLDIYCPDAPTIDGGGFARSRRFVCQQLAVHRFARWAAIRISLLSTYDALAALIARYFVLASSQFYAVPRIKAHHELRT